MSTELDHSYTAIKMGPKKGESVKKFMWRATAGMVVVAAEQATTAIDAPEKSEKIALALASAVNTYTGLVYPYYGRDGSFMDAVKDPGKLTRLKEIITTTASDLSATSMQGIIGAAKIWPKDGPTNAVQNTPISFFYEELHKIHPFLPDALPTEQLLLETLEKKVSHPEATAYRNKMTRVIRRTYARSKESSQLDINEKHTVILGNRQAALLWQTRLLFKAATQNNDGSFNTHILLDWQFAPYNTMVRLAFETGLKTHSTGIAGLAHALITMLQDHAECVLQIDWDH